MTLLIDADYIAYTYNSVAGIGTRTPAAYQRHDANNNPVGVGTYQREHFNDWLRFRRFRVLIISVTH